MPWYNPFSWRKENPVGLSIVKVSGERPQPTPRNYKQIAFEAYQTNIFVYAGVRLKSMAIASLTYKVFQGTADDAREVPDHPLQQLILRPNPQNTQTEYLEGLATNLINTGNGYEVVSGPDRQPPTEMYQLRPDRVRVIPGTDMGTIGGFVWGEGSERQTFTTEQMHQIKLFNPVNDWYGQSFTDPAARSIDLNNEGKVHNVALMQNRGMPMGQFVTDKSLTDPQFARIKEQIDAMFSGSLNRGRPWVSENGLKFEDVGLSPAEMELVQQNKITALEILAGIGVPPELVGIEEHKIYNTFREARKALFITSALPEAQRVVDGWNTWLAPKFGDDLFIKIDKRQIDALQEEASILFERANTADFLTVNEKRELVGKEPVTGGDVILTPINVIPLGATPQTEERSTHAGELKSYGLQGDEQKHTYYKTLDQRRIKATDAVTPVARRRLRDELNAVIDAIENSSSVQAIEGEVIKAVDDGFDDWSAFYDAVYIGVGEDFARDTFDSMLGQKSASAQERKQEFDDWLTFMTAYLTRIRDSKIRDVTDTTKKRVLDVVAEGVADSLTIDQIAKQVDEIVRPIIPNRGEVIARTEVINASNAASEAGAEATGLIYEKEWLPTPGARTREEHAAMTATSPVQKGEPFTVGGELLMHPGDTSLGASAGNVIQCRCTLIFQPVRVGGVPVRG